ncbi:unnamed protein product [Musa banksii]
MLQHHDNTKDRLENNIVLHKKQFLENIREKMDRCRMPPVSISKLDINRNRLGPTLFDLNARPHRVQDHITDSSQVQALHLDYQLIGKVRISAWANTNEPLKRKNQFKK